MKCYHFTKKDNLKTILEKGLIPKNGKNSKMIGDTKTKVFFSEGFTGCIALYVDFNIVYEDIKTGKETPGANIISQVMSSNSIEDYLGEGVYLAFDKKYIFNERNFENGCTSENIKSDELYVCLLNINDNIVDSQYEIIKYMMANTNFEDIIYYGAEYDGAPPVEAATKRIQDKVQKYYDKYKNNFITYKNYKLEYIPLKEYLNNYPIKQ